MENTLIGLFNTIRDSLSNISNILTAHSLIVAVVLVIFFIICVFIFTKTINKKTRNQILSFKNEGKYLPSVFVEYNNSMEYLRYFVFSNKWKHRVIKQYNHLFHGYEGKRLKWLIAQLEKDTKYRLSYFTSIPKLQVALKTMHEILDGLRKHNNELYENHGETVFVISNSTYLYSYAIGHLQSLCDMMRQKNVVLVGSAGNGKTSLMCRLSEIAIAYKIPCLLINSRDIKENCSEYVINKFPGFPKFKKVLPLYLFLISLFLRLQNKYFYIFIDAINENDRDVFTSGIAGLLDTFANYSRIRILLSCRSEYFDLRYKMLFSTGKVKPYIFNLTKNEPDGRATEKIITAYRDHFNVRGPIPNEMQAKIWKSLLLTRIFFEVNSNRDECMLEFRNAEIYKMYFDKISTVNKDINLKEVVSRVAKYMFDEFQFDKMPIEELNLSSDDLESLRQLLDNNLIISHSIHTGIGITEREEEYVYFVFDDLRDCCLARYLLTLDEHNSSTEYAFFFSNVARLFENGMSPTEGLVKYAYHHFRMIKRPDLCKKILIIFGRSNVMGTLRGGNQGLHRKRTFDNFGLSLIFSEGPDIISFETEYILNSIESNCNHYWTVFWFLLEHEYSGFKPDLDLAVELMARCKDEKLFERIMESFFNDREDKYLLYFDMERRVDRLKNRLDAIKRRNGVLSKNLKVLVTLLVAYDPSEYALEEYHDYVMNDDLYELIQNSDFCKSIKALVGDFRDRVMAGSIDLELFQRQNVYKNGEI